jgi:ABC-type polysaccharide/polyol phosphate export permease
MPLSVVLSNMVKFGIQLLLLVAAMIWYAINGMEIHSGSSLFLIPVVILMMACMGLGLGIIISSLTSKLSYHPSYNQTTNQSLRPLLQNHPTLNVYSNRLVQDIVGLGYSL